MSIDEITKRVRAARSYAGITQEDMASRLDMSPVTYKRIEQGRRPISLTELDRIAEITGWPREMFQGALAASSGEEREELEGLRSSIQGLVARLEDIEYRMRTDVTQLVDSAKK